MSKLSHFKQISGAQGSNTGGMFEHKETGERFYVKRLDTDDHARNEVLAAKLYELAGVKVPEVKFVEIDNHLLGGHGSDIGVASKIIEGLQKLPRDISKVKGVAEGFAADAWLANWDVVGLSYDNLLHQDGEAVRIDHGGALKYRAQGAPKGSRFGDDPLELESLRDMSMNPQAASVFSQVLPHQIARGIETIKSISDASIRAVVRKYGPPDVKENLDLADKLIRRRDSLAAKLSRFTKTASRSVWGRMARELDLIAAHLLGVGRN